MINKMFNFQSLFFKKAGSTKRERSRGMTLFISIVIMGILLFISFAVVNITLKATLFASSGRDSQYAFYAADAGLECAIYWDSRFVTGYVGSDPLYGSAFSTSTARTISCAGRNISGGQAIAGTSTVSRVGGGGVSNPVSAFGIVLDQGLDPVPYCAVVTVTKNGDGSTHIKSRGYNTCVSGARRVERGVEVTY